MTTHKERIDAINKKGFSLPRSYLHISQNGVSNSHIPDNEKRLRRTKTERIGSEDDSIYQQPISPLYQNAALDQDKFDFDDVDKPRNILDRKPMTNSQPNINTNRTNNTSKSYLTMQGNTTLPASQLLYKSQSLNALKTKEPTKSLAKSTIQQEFHDKRVQRHFRDVSSGPAKRPCMIATILFVIFGVLFIVGLTLICLTYIYKNITFSLDKGEMIGPLIMAGSFIFLGVAIKFVYDAHKIIRKNRHTITYRGYDRRYVGLTNGSNGAKIPNEKLVSGTTTDIGMTRVPNRKQLPINNVRTLGVSSQKLYGHIRDA